MSKNNEDIDKEFCHIPMGDGTYRDSDQKDKITRMVILGPGCMVSSKELMNFLHLLELPLNIRLTCYGANINGYKEEVLDIKLLYVAITRAMSKIDIYYIGNKSKLL